MKRWFSFAALGVLAATAAAMAYLARWEPGPAPEAAAPVLATPVAPEPELTVMPVLPVPEAAPKVPLAPQAARIDHRATRRRLAARAAPPPPGGVILAHLPSAPPPGEWAAVPVVSPFGAGTPAPQVTRALGAVKARLARCFDPAEQTRWVGHGGAWSRAPEFSHGPAMGPAILILEAEADGATVTVVDAPAEARGAVSDAALTCAQAALRGVQLPVATQGSARFRMRYALRP